MPNNGLRILGSVFHFRVLRLVVNSIWSVYCDWIAGATNEERIYSDSRHETYDAASNACKLLIYQSV